MVAFSSVVASGCERMWLHTTWFDNISSCAGIVWQAKPLKAVPCHAIVTGDYTIHEAKPPETNAGSIFERCFSPKICLFLCWEYSWVVYCTRNIESSSSINQVQLVIYNQVSLRIYLRCIRSTALLGTSTSHHRKRKIILKRFQKCLGRGYVSSLESICKHHLHTIQHSPRPQHYSLAAMPILQRIWLISKHAHEVKATENRIREIHILWESPAFCGLPLLSNGFWGWLLQDYRDAMWVPLYFH